MRSLMARLQQGFGTGEIGAGVKLRSSNFEPSTSALRQKQTFKRLRLMSALPPKADIGTQSRNVRFVPKADMITSHLAVQDPLRATMTSDS
jgi:hypothetical protein